MSYFYEVIIPDRYLHALTYYSFSHIEIGSEVVVPLNNYKTKAYILKPTEKKTFSQPITKFSFQPKKISFIHLFNNDFIYVTTAILPILSITQNYLSTFQLNIANFMATYYITPLSNTLALFTPFRKNRTTLKEKKTIFESIVLTLKQQEALSFIKQHPISLLFGDTGSGKTEIYMRYMQEFLDKTILFLVPEVSLTPQMRERLEKNFGKILVIHGKITNRKKVLQEIHEGNYSIILGSMATLFLPLENLGLIIVDEEHDESYKFSLKAPLYNARDIAIYMAKRLDIPIVLGSATPSVSSYYKFPTFRLKGNFADAKKRILIEQSETKLSALILQKIEQSLDKKEQVIIFIPTRANFKYLTCSKCHATITCPFCSVSMSLYLDKSFLRCNFCNFTKSIPQQCESCGFEYLIPRRKGTHEILNNLKEIFPNAKVAQFDKDSIKSEKKLKETLSSFNNHEIDILVGTQMLSKGHNYHKVNLSIILGIDNLFSLSDYRSEERAMSLIFQVAGRSGRAQDAEVIIQTQQIEKIKPYLIDYEQFIQKELLFREDFYPPFSTLATLYYAHPKETKAQEVLQIFQKELESMVEILASGEAPIAKLNNKYRIFLLLKSSKRTHLIQMLHHLLAKLPSLKILPKDVRFDIDPLTIN